MTIQRLDPQPRMSEAVIYQQTLYYTSVPEDLTGDIAAQTRDALQVIDRMLARVGSDKSKILDATLFLSHKADFAEMNRVWDAWVDPNNAPVRCTVQASLMDPNYKVEIKVIAAV